MSLSGSRARGLGGNSFRCKIGEFRTIMCTFLGGPFIRTIVYWSLCWGTLILASYHCSMGCPVACKLLREHFSQPPRTQKQRVCATHV